MEVLNAVLYLQVPGKLFQLSLKEEEEEQVLVPSHELVANNPSASPHIKQAREDFWRNDTVVTDTVYP